MDDGKRAAFMVVYATVLLVLVMVLATCTAAPDADHRARAFTVAGYFLAVAGVSWVVAGLVGIAVHRAGQRRRVRRSNET